MIKTPPHPPLFLIAAIIILIAALGSQVIAARWIPPTDRFSASDRPTALSAIAQLQDRLKRRPGDAAAYAQLGWALLLRARETGDASWYGQAQAAFEAALERQPDQIDAVAGLGSVALSRHQFYEALELGQQALALNPHRAQVYGILADAYTELGEYDFAAAMAQKMIDTRPDVASYSRVAYQRELRGDVAGALEAMQRAVAAGTPGAESTRWAQYQLGNLHFNRGDLDGAEAAYQAALAIRPDDVFAHFGLARVVAARGPIAAAIPMMEEVVNRLPLAEFVIALGELYEMAGRSEEAQAQYRLVGAMQALQADAGVDVDLELALFDLDHGFDAAGALDRARAAYARRPSLYAADVLAWALYHNGSLVEARRYSVEALRLGTRDALLHFHAGAIELALGDRAAARAHLALALSINPHFSLRFAPQARAWLDQLSKD